MVGGDEADRELALRIGVTSVVLGLVKLFQFGLHHIVVNVGVLLLHDAFQSAVGLVIDAVFGAEAGHMAVGDAQGQVGVGEEVAVGHHLHHALDVLPHQLVDLLSCLVVAVYLFFGADVTICHVK